MRKPTLEQAGKFLLFASPCYWTLAVLFIVLVIWKVGFSEPDLIPVTLVTIAVIAAAVLLTKKYYWISLPMIALGIYIALQEDQFVEHIFQIYGTYLALHYLVCGIYVFHNRKKDSG